MTHDLFAAIDEHDLDHLARQLAHGADANAMRTDPPAWRPLHAAIEELEWDGSVEAIILLLRSGADVNGWDADHDATPLLMALFRGQPAAVHILLGAEADPNVVGAEGDSPLRWSVAHDDLAMAATLLRCGAARTMNGAGGLEGMTALGLAAHRLNAPMVALLLQAGADPEALDNDYRPARKRMPPREATNAPAWDAVVALLAGDAAHRE